MRYYESGNSEIPDEAEVRGISTLLSNPRQLCKHQSWVIDVFTIAGGMVDKGTGMCGKVT